MVRVKYIEVGVLPRLPKLWWFGYDAPALRLMRGFANFLLGRRAAHRARPSDRPRRPEQVPHLTKALERQPAGAIVPPGRISVPMGFRKWKVENRNSPVGGFRISIFEFRFSSLQRSGGMKGSEDWPQ
jgi:hypothetical protein